MTHAAWVKMMIFHNWKIISSDGHHLFFHFNTQTSNRNYDINSIKSGFSLCNNWAIEHVADFDKDLEWTSQSGICDQGRRESNDLGRTDRHKPEFSENFFGKKWEEHGQCCQGRSGQDENESHWCCNQFLKIKFIGVSWQ